jgi:hypothetical protein
MTRPPKRAALGALALAALLAPSAASGQEATVPAEDHSAAANVRRVGGGPNDRSLKTTDFPELQFESTSDEKKLSLAVSMQVSGRPPRSDDSNMKRISYSQLSIKGSLPLEANDGVTRVTALKTLPAGTEASLGFTRFWGSMPKPSDWKVDLAEAERSCRDDFPDTVAANMESVGSPAVSVNKYCHQNGSERGSITSFIKRYDYAKYRDHLRTVFPRPINFIGADATGSQKDFEFADPVAVALGRASRFSYRGSVYFGQIYPVRVASVTASFSYVREYEAGAPTTVCQPTNSSQCVPGPGAPVVIKRAVVSVEGRQMFGFSQDKPPRFAIAPELSYDIENRAFSADVPIYFVTNGEGQLNGGVRLTYLNEKKVGGTRKGDVALSVFVGLPFKSLSSFFQ